MSDVDLARLTKPRPIQEIGKLLGLSPEEIHPHGRHIGKVSLAALERLKHRPQARYVLVTAINPHPWEKERRRLPSD